MNIKTGYFAQGKKYEAQGYMVVGITRFPPKWFNGLNLIALSPSVGALNAYKDGSITWDEFVRIYEGYLNDSKETIKTVLDTLNKLETNNIVLCCFEKDSTICHRSILAKFLNTNFGYNIEEFVF
jgi:uncharacterized protein YeaO (DUF488 family)